MYLGPICIRMCNLSAYSGLYYAVSLHIFFCCFLLLLSVFTRSYFGLFEMCQTILTRTVLSSLTSSMGQILWPSSTGILSQENNSLILHKFFWRLGSLLRLLSLHFLDMAFMNSFLLWTACVNQVTHRDCWLFTFPLVELGFNFRLWCVK